MTLLTLHKGFLPFPSGVQQHDQLCVCVTNLPLIYLACSERGYWVLREAIQNFAVPDGNTFGAAGADSNELIRDFIQQCLCTDPVQRPSADALLLHPYIVRAVQRGLVSADGSRPPRLRDALVLKCPATSAEVDDIVDHIVQW